MAKDSPQAQSRDIKITEMKDPEINTTIVGTIIEMETIVLPEETTADKAKDARIITTSVTQTTTIETETTATTENKVETVSSEGNAASSTMIVDRDRTVLDKSLASQSTTSLITANFTATIHNSSLE